jgi:hypothetical protein
MVDEADLIPKLLIGLRKDVREGLDGLRAKLGEHDSRFDDVDCLLAQLAEDNDEALKHIISLAKIQGVQTEALEAHASDFSAREK